MLLLPADVMVDQLRKLEERFCSCLSTLFLVRFAVSGFGKDPLKVVRNLRPQLVVRCRYRYLLKIVDQVGPGRVYCRLIQLSIS